MTTVPCLEMPALPELPSLEIPQFGVLEAARQSLYDLPDLSVYLMSMQELAGNALAPLRRFLEMIEVIVAIKSCQYKANIDIALELGDIELGAINDCAGEQAYKLVVNAMDILNFISPILSILLNPLARLMPIPELRKILKDLSSLPAVLAGIQADIEAAQGPPALGALMESITGIRNITVWLYNILAPVVGRDGDQQPRTMPSFENF